MTVLMQTTLKKPVRLLGAGVHSGAPVTLTLHPALAGHGIVFLRKGLDDGGERRIEAHHSNVSSTALCTVIGRQDSGSVSTIEHLMSVFGGLEIDNVLVEIDGPEMPILDGSAAGFIDAIDRAGLVSLNVPRRFIKVLKPVRVELGEGFAELRPASDGFELDVEIDFETSFIGRQRMVASLDPEVYRSTIACARTFGFMNDVKRLWKAGLARGASFDNTVAVGEKGVLNPEGLRYPDEFVRHKLLDAVGDLALAGHRLIGAYRSYRGGHGLNVAILKALFANRSNFTFVFSNALASTASADQCMADENLLIAV